MHIIILYYTYNEPTLLIQIQLKIFEVYLKSIYVSLVVILADLKIIWIFVKSKNKGYDKTVHKKHTGKNTIIKAKEIKI